MYHRFPTDPSAVADEREAHYTHFSALRKQFLKKEKFVRTVVYQLHLPSLYARVNIRLHLSAMTPFGE
jgi:hypothetical protein